jgi:hypothetical protein
MADDLILNLDGTDYLAVVLAAVASFLIGWLWYGPLFGKAWAKDMGMDMNQKPEAKAMLRGMALGLVGSLLTAYVLWHSIMVWLPSLWAAHFDTTATNSPAAAYAAHGAFFIWLGYFLPTQLSKLAWERGTWRLLLINGGHDLVRLFAMAFIIAFMAI